MKISINPAYVEKRPDGSVRTMEECFRLCREAGFTVFDFTVNPAMDSWEDNAKRLADYAAKIGAEVHQSHSPMNRYAKLDPDLHRERVRRMIKATAIMGGKYVVIHADEYWAPEGKPFSPEDALAWIVEYYRPMVEYAAELGLTVAVENLFEDGFNLRPIDARNRYTHYAEEVIAVMDAFKEYGAGCCFDYGHGHVAYGDRDVEAAAKLADRIVCTHVHDNYYNRDLHLLPYCGKVNWAAHMQILRDAGYTGNLNLELVYGSYPDELVGDMLAWAYRAATTLEGELRG